MCQVIRSALLDAASTPGQLSGLQLHGTGTALGDPIEMGAIIALEIGETDGRRIMGQAPCCHCCFLVRLEMVLICMKMVQGECTEIRWR